jgi:F-type H+-transporting ATPase subunit a
MLSVFDFHEWKPFAAYGYHHPFFTIHIDTIMFTWCAMALLTATCTLAIYLAERHQHTVAGFTVRYSVKGLINLATETLGTFNRSVFVFAMGLFLFTLSCSFVSLIPMIEEATRDLNTALAIGTISFVFVQYQGFKAHGLAHLNDFIKPFFILLPLNVMGELAKIASMSFRLFGNILAGSVILQLFTGVLESISWYFYVYLIIVGMLGFIMWKKELLLEQTSGAKFVRALLWALFIPAFAQLFFGVFEGLVQSLVIGILTLTYTSLLTTQPDEEH